MPAAGTSIDGRYEIESLIGRGGMADVFRAHDPVTDEAVALKLLRLHDGRSTARFRTEIEALRRLDHPSIVRLRGAGWHGSSPYLVLDLVTGPSLAARLAEGALGLEPSVDLVARLAEGLAHAHRHGVIHRDVKPSNVLFHAPAAPTAPSTGSPDSPSDGPPLTPGSTSGGSPGSPPALGSPEASDVRLADFGIARLGDGTRLTTAGTCVGTAAYLAPEQLEGGGGPPVDVFSLGLVLLECLTGVLCYSGTIAETALARLHRAPVVPADLPGWLRHTIQAMTARDPARRPPAGAAAEALAGRSVEPVLTSTSVIDLAAVRERRSPDAAAEVGLGMPRLDDGVESSGLDALADLADPRRRPERVVATTPAQLHWAIRAAVLGAAVVVSAMLVLFDDGDGSPVADTTPSPAAADDDVPATTLAQVPVTTVAEVPVTTVVPVEPVAQAETPPPQPGPAGPPAHAGGRGRGPAHELRDHPQGPRSDEDEADDEDSEGEDEDSEDD